MESQARKCLITYPSSMFSSSVTGEFPVLVVLPTEATDSGDSNHANADGGDIRIKDGTDTTEKAREVVSFALDGAYQIWAALTNPSAVANTYLYVYYKDSGASEPAAGSTYGSQNAWDSNFKGVYHLEEAVNNDAGGYKDATANANHMTGNSMSLTPPAGAIGVAAEFDGLADYMAAAPTLPTQYTMSGWVYIDTETSDTSGLFATFAEAPGDGVHDRGLGWYAAGDEFTSYQYDGGGKTAYSGAVSPPTGAWYHAAVKYDGSYITACADGSPGTPVSSGNPYTGYSSAELVIARNASNYFDGRLDEFRLSNTGRSDAWLAAEYAVVNSLGSVTAGTPEAVGGVSAFTFGGRIARRGESGDVPVIGGRVARRN